VLEKNRDLYVEHRKVASAFTVVELGEMSGLYFSSHNEDEFFRCFGEVDGRVRRFTASPEADARAKMLIFLLEKGLAKAYCPIQSE
jgi:hypothetical protein